MEFISPSSQELTEVYILRKENSYEIANLENEKSYKWTCKSVMGLSSTRGLICRVYPNEYQSEYKFVDENKQYFGILNHKSTLIKQRFYGTFKCTQDKLVSIYVKMNGKVTYIFNDKPQNGGILLARGEKRFNGKHGLFSNRKYYVLQVAGDVDAEFMTCIWLTARESINRQTKATASGKQMGHAM